MSNLLDFEGSVALPRRNGDVVFDEIWHGRVFAIAEAVVKTKFEGNREPFRLLLIESIARDPQRQYWQSWTDALARLLIEHNIISFQDIDFTARLILPNNLGE